jgi:hypothetical protein
MTPLDKTLKRVLRVDGRDYVITLTPDALKLTAKGHRIGVDLKWADLISGESALAVALNASLGKFAEDTKTVARTGVEHAPRPIDVKTSAPVALKKRVVKRAARQGKKTIRSGSAGAAPPRQRTRGVKSS